MKVGAVILAAGLSSRMGACKPLLPIGDSSMLAHAVESLRSGGVETVVVVTGHDGTAVCQEAQRLGVECCDNPDYLRGMLSSVQAGLRRLPKVDAFFLLPVDIPLVRPVTIRRLLDQFDGKRVLLPVFQKKPGHPPLIPGKKMGKIIAYAGPGGLDRYLKKQKVREVAVWDHGILLDADTQEEYRRLQQRWSRLAVGEPQEAVALALQAMPERGVRHGQMVAAVALAIGQRLCSNGLGLDLDLIHNGALLHDIAKGAPFHEQRGGSLLAGLGLTALVDVVSAHRDIGPPEAGELTEKEVVGLADKFVHGDDLVSLRQRYEEKLTRYAADPEACRSIRRRLERAESLLALVEYHLGCPVEHLLVAIPLVPVPVGTV
ncbi:DVU_1551 family NTP transferase [Desulfofustis limnaeus]|jgi:CTP:molybdopterin cytidylyltransferase MocA|uniref:Phosphohydrolase n=1 Tax=Desulfofustis limnaeus TaxID=2740163 RepID=A0ABN6M069_9BACT|nr:NTP transferase domain-containing protein [Desulfofustis limnaeus]MDX9896244.1 NTP transferase domain-containing protein [Desulfofustis sp.]BDD86276.1 phosphohydrolase [Desulfofustis limnaeus]